MVLGVSAAACLGTISAKSATSRLCNEKKDGKKRRKAGDCPSDS